jgi:hypothetical protein
MRSLIWYESLNERDYMYLLEIDPDVRSYNTQPFKISYILDEKSRRYTPDFLVQRQSKQQIIEIKPTNWFNDEKNVTKMTAIASTLKSMGWEFIIITDEMMNQDYLLNNIKLLYRYVQIPLTLQNLTSCYQYFQKNSPTTLEIALRELEVQKINKPLLLKLIFVGFLSTNLKEKIQSNSLIYLDSSSKFVQREGK